MIEITQQDLTKEIESLLDLGLDNKQIAGTLNEKYNADKKNSLTASSVSSLRKTLNIKKKRAQKVPLFKIVENHNESLPVENEDVEYNDPMDDVVGQPYSEEPSHPERMSF